MGLFPVASARCSGLTSFPYRVLGMVGTLIIALPLQANPPQPDIQAVVGHLVGIMDTSAQAAANPNAPSVQMTTCSVAIADDPKATYLYQEQALMAKLDQPYRQRLLLIYFDDRQQKIAVQSFKLAKAEDWAGLCQRESRSRRLGDRGESVCTVWLEPSERGFVGETPPQGCPSNVRGAVAVTNRIYLMDAGMDTWDRGLDAQGNQVWGAKEEGYQYRWQKRGDSP
jgi:hypothetical protein